jgi:hypothetical protein
MKMRNNYGMGRPKGLAKTGGRKLGTPNKNSQALSERLESLGCDPIEGLARIALDPATKPELKVRCFAELAQYVYPKRKAVDLALNEWDESRSPKVVIEYIGRPDRTSALTPEQ